MRILSLFATLCFGMVTQGAESLRAGAAKIDITPPIGYPMWGYAARHDAPSVGVLEPLFARALVIAVGDQRIALVGLDLGRAPTRDSTEVIRKKVREAGITEIFLVGSHTHHGPVIELDQWPDAKTSYVRALESKLAQVIIDAAKQLQPARIGIARKACVFNRNRHSKRDDRPIDNELLVLRVETTDGKLIAHAVNFAAHPTMIETKIHRFSPDYVGHLCGTVEKETGVPCVFLQGAAGDMSPNSTPERKTYDLFGQAIGEEVLQIAKTIRCEVPKTPALISHHETLRFRARIDVANPIIKRAISEAFFPDLVAFYEREYREGVRPELTLALLNEKIGIVGVSGEVFCAHSLSLKRRARLEHVLFLGYCNDYQQYFPTIEACAEGGYGTVPPVGLAEVGAGEKIIDRALLKLYQMRELIDPEN